MGSVRLTKETFVNKANEVHGIGRYLYHKADFIDSNTKTLMVCGECDHEWLQRPKDHLRGAGCPNCKKVKLSVLKFKGSDFVRKANEIHHGSCEYPDPYVGYDIPMRMICKRHGEFYQTPEAHLRGRRCPVCAQEYRIDSRYNK